MRREFIGESLTPLKHSFSIPFSSFSNVCFAGVFLFFCFNFCQGSYSLYAVLLKLLLCFKQVLRNDLLTV